MPTPKAELKARLMAEAETAIDQLLAARTTPAEASLADIEREARTASQRIAQAVTSAFVAESAAELPTWPNCPQCGRKMKNKGRHRRRVVTETGEVELKRAYYYCASCHRGFFPPG